MDQKNSELDQLRIKSEQSSTETTNIKDELEQMKTKYNQTTVEDTKQWEELKGVRNENTKLKKDLDVALATTQRLQAELHGKQTKVDRIVTLRGLVAATTARDKLPDALKSKDEDLAFLRGHLSHLSEKLPKALPPSEEEAQKKGW